MDSGGPCVCHRALRMRYSTAWVALGRSVSALQHCPRSSAPLLFVPQPSPSHASLFVAPSSRRAFAAAAAGKGSRTPRRFPIKAKMAHAGCKIAVLGDLSWPHLTELRHLPPTAQIVASGTSLEDFAGKEAVLAQADVLLASPPCGRDLMTKMWHLCPQIKWVHCLFAGLDHLLFKELVDSPVTLTNAKGLFSSSLAEYALMSMSYFAKDVPRLNAQKAQAAWTKFSVKELRGATLGIVGYGDIGMATARLAKAYGMTVIALRRRPGESSDDHLVDKVLPPTQLHELMSECDYVLVAAALTPDTRGMVNAAALACAKPGQVLINLGRGPLIEEAALVEALESGRLRGAALDVFDKEPLPSDHVLWKMPNVLLSPHNADQTETFLHESVQFFGRNVERYLEGSTLHNIVDKTAGY